MKTLTTIFTTLVFSFFINTAFASYGLVKTPFLFNDASEQTTDTGGAGCKIEKYNTANGTFLIVRVLATTELVVSNVFAVHSFTEFSVANVKPVVATETMELEEEGSL